jgi:hypothetical protein
MVSCAGAPQAAELWTQGPLGPLLDSAHWHCMDADTRTLDSPGTLVQLRPCLTAAGNQTWIWRLDGTIHNAAQTGQCLQADPRTLSSYLRAAVQLGTCSGSSFQQWRLDGYNQVELAGTVNDCLAALSSTIGSVATNLIVYGCSYSPADTYEHFIPLRQVTLVNQANWNCLDADTGGLGGNGTTVQVRPCQWGWSNQAWDIFPWGTIINNANLHCLDANASTWFANGTRVQLWDCNGRSNQQWLTWWDDSIHSGAVTSSCIDADMRTINQATTNVTMWTCVGGARNQEWYQKYEYA